MKSPRGEWIFLRALDHIMKLLTTSLRTVRGPGNWKLQAAISETKFQITRRKKRKTKNACHWYFLRHSTVQYSTLMLGRRMVERNVTLRQHPKMSWSTTTRAMDRGFHARSILFSRGGKIRLSSKQIALFTRDLCLVSDILMIKETTDKQGAGDQLGSLSRRTLVLRRRCTSRDEARRLGRN